MIERTPFGEWLRQRRHLLNLTQSALAAQSDCSAVTIRKLESGDRKPSIELAQSLALALRIPEREQPAFIQFARSDEFEASNPLPAWEPERVSWRDDQLPDHRAAPVIDHTGMTIHYDLVGPEPPQYEKVEDGRLVAKVIATGSLTGDIEGTMDIQFTQIIQLSSQNQKI